MVKGAALKSKSVHNNNKDVIDHGDVEKGINNSNGEKKNPTSGGVFTPTMISATATGSNTTRPSLSKTSIVVTMKPSGLDWINRQFDDEILSLRCWNSNHVSVLEQREQDDDHHNHNEGTEATSLTVLPRDEIMTLLDKRSWFRLRFKTAMDTTMFLVFVSLFFLIPCHVPHAWWIYYASGSCMLAVGLVGYGTHLWISHALKTKFLHAVFCSTTTVATAKEHKNLAYEQLKENGFPHLQVTIQKQNCASWLKRQTRDEILSIVGWTKVDLIALRSLLHRKQLQWIKIYFVLFMVLVMESMDIFWKRFSSELWAMGNGVAGCIYSSVFGGFLPLFAIFLWFIVTWLDHSVYEMFSERFERRKSSSSRKRRRRTTSVLPTVHEEQEEQEEQEQEEIVVV